MNDFNARAAEWDTPQRVKKAQRVAAAIEGAVTLDPSMDVMEYGCGTGLVGLQLLAKIGTATFIDTSEGMLEVLSSKLAQQQLPNAQVCNVDLSADTSFSGAYDLIFSSMTLHHIPDYAAILARFSGLLKPGGKLAIVDLVSEDGSFHGAGFEGHNGFDLAQLAQAFGAAGLAVTHSDVFMEMKRENGRRYPLFLIVGAKAGV
nr:class I SAM-dependent methyltransferase [uncultured Acetobacteroides sp.]